MGWVHFGRLQDEAREARAALVACAALAAALVPLPAAAQSVAHPLLAGEILDTTTLQNDADMDFGDILPSGSNGTVVMTPDAAATCTTTVGLVRTGPCKAAAFSGTALSGAELRVKRPTPNSMTLTGPGGATMTVTTFTLGSTAPTVYLGNNGNSPNHRFQVNAPDGSFTFYVAGTLNVGATQLPGIYNGTFEIEISYN